MSRQRLATRGVPFAALLALSVAVIALVSPAAGASRTPSAHRVVGPALGVMLDRPAGSKHGRRVSPSKRAAKLRRSRSIVRGRQGHQVRLNTFLACPDPTCNMTYHLGDLVLGPHTTHVVYWEPPGFSVTPNYHSLVERYFTDVAADSGRVTNVYATDTQYDDSGNNFIQYQQTFAGALTDTNAFPATVAGCPLTDGTNTVANCLTQTQEATELDNFIQANSLPRGLDHIYFLMLPDNVESCVDSFSNCGNILDINPRYCAYHSFFNIGGHGLTLWANEPYIGFGHSPAHCNSGSTNDRPNGDLTDHELNVLSHEHNEVITNPNNGGWFDTNGTGENGDKCNFNFGTPIASNTNGNYNQLINHNPYEIQLEWSNAITGCAANFGALDPTAAFTFSPPSPKALDPVSFDGSTSHSNNTGGYIIDWQWDFGDTGTASGANPSHTYAAAGTYTVALTVKDDAGLTNTVTHPVTVGLRPTTTTYTGDTSGDYHDAVTLSGNLVDTASSAPLASKTMTFSLGTQSCSGTTDSFGSASCSLTLNQIPGAYAVTAAYAGDATVYLGSSDTEAFTIEREETTLTYTGPTVILANASSLTVTATLVEDGANDDDGDPGSAPPNPPGQTVTFTLGTQSCSGLTDATGAVSCTIPSVSASLGSQTLTATFTGDSYYLPSSDTAQVLVFAFPSRGAFVLGDESVAAATPTTTLTWWGSNWSSLNSVSGGGAVPSFKGFAENVSTLPSTSPASVCGLTFTTSPGNSVHPPATVPAYMGVIVANAVSKSGSTINGNWARVVVVQTDPGYEPNPGHPGTGTIAANFCG
jgi:PKD repeat protein